MKFVLYQSDKRDFRYLSYEEYIDIHKTDKIYLANYTEVYEGYRPYKELHSYLEGLFEEFNLYHPPSFKGRSLAVGDIIKVNERYYFCDRLGFKDITKNIILSNNITHFK